LWSLPYEVQMYLLLPAIFLYLQKRKSAALLWVAGLVIAALPVRIVGPHFKATVRFFPCFLSGCRAYALTKTQRAKLPGFLWPIAILGVLVF
jgi:peptidoglycan/LPS O-acetylase OafA/YrhL